MLMLVLLLVLHEYLVLQWRQCLQLLPVRLQRLGLRQ